MHFFAAAAAILTWPTDNSIWEYGADCYCFCHLQRVCKLRGWAKDTPKNKETYDVMMEIWTGLRSKADKDNDGQVSCGFRKGGQLQVSSDSVRFGSVFVKRIRLHCQ